MSEIAKHSQRIWKSAQLYIGFYTDPKGKKRDQPKVWPPKNANATIHSNPDEQEAFLEIKADPQSNARDIQMRLRPDKLVLRRHNDGIGWDGIIIEDDQIAVKVAGNWVRIKVDGGITRESEGDTTYIEADGSVLKKTEFVDALMSGDGVELSRRTPDTIAAITDGGVVAKARDKGEDTGIT